MKTAIELEESNSKEYKVKAIRNSAVYAIESDSDHHLLGLYYLVSLKKLPQGKKHLGACFGVATPSQTY